MPGKGRDWRGDSLEHLRRSFPSWLSAYDIARKLDGTGMVPGTGRCGTSVKKACEQLHAEGLADRREIRPEGSPYGKPRVYYRAARERKR